MDAAKYTAGETALNALTDGREDVLLVLEAALALFHLAPQVGPRVEPKAVVGVVEVMQPVTEPAQCILEQPDLLAGLNDAEHHALELQPTNAKALALLGLAYFRGGMFHDAAPVYQALVAQAST